ncbi:MAG: polysaccharide biosynthesis tyrosine autokinase [Pseudomonadota bacterium]
MNDMDTALIEDTEDAVGPSNSVPLLPDPGLLWQVFRRNIMLFFAVVMAIIGLTAVFLFLQVPTYSTTATLLIEPAADPVRTTGPREGVALALADPIDTEIRLVGSPVVAERAGRLYAERFASPDGDPFTEEEIELLGRRMRGSALITRSGQTRVIDITAINTDPAFAAASANLIAEAYLQGQIDTKTARTDATLDTVNAKMAELERNAVEAQAAVDNYRAARGLVSANGSTNAEQEVSNLNQQLASARADLAEKQGRLSAAQTQLQRGGSGADVGAALNSGTVSNLRQEESRLSAELSVLQSRYGPLHPERVEAEAKLSEVRGNIQQEINRVISNLQADVQTAQSRVSSLQGSRSTALGALQRNGQSQAGLTELEQRAAAAQAIFQAFLSRSQESGALRDTAMADAVLTARASVPEFPSSPNYPLISAAGVFVAFVAGFVSIGLAEYLRRGIQTKRDVERKLQLRYAGAIPTLKSTLDGKKTDEEPHDYVISNPHSLFAESFRSVRTFLTLSPGKRPRAIAITSALPGEGKTTTSVCVARTAAAEGSRILLVDADFRRRGSSELITYESDFDIFNYIAGDAKLEDCIYRDEMSGLDVLGSNEAIGSQQLPLTQERIERMFNELKDRYDAVIVDTAPLLGVAEGRIIASCADRVLVVTQWKKTSARAVEAAVDMLTDAKAKVTGLSLTQVDIRRYASTGEGDVYAYTKKFRGYYQN